MKETLRNTDNDVDTMMTLLYRTIDKTQDYLAMLNSS